MSEPNWQRITFPFPSDTALREGFRITAAAQQRDREIGSPHGFAVFTAPEFYDDDPQRSSQVYYFSPVAAQGCADIIAAYSPALCNAPDPETFGLSLAYGTLQTSESWDLLK